MLIVSSDSISVIFPGSYGYHGQALVRHDAPRLDRGVHKKTFSFKHFAPIWAVQLVECFHSDQLCSQLFE